MRTIGLFGGTFDPPHVAHLIIAQEALEACRLDEVWFVPSNVPPHVQGKYACASAQDRAEMVRLSIQNNDRFKLETSELCRSGPSYTVETLRQLHRKYPDCIFYFILGADMVSDLKTWHGIGELCRLTRFIGFSRPGYLPDPPKSADLTMIDIPTLAISSSALRGRIESGRSCRYFLTDSVASYIKERQLYGCGRGTTND
ncbi:MAG: nicotinate-nucleotide adenylyltransferase [Sporolactobacillus sp.]